MPRLLLFLLTLTLAALACDRSAEPATPATAAPAPTAAHQERPASPRAAARDGLARVPEGGFLLETDTPDGLRLLARDALRTEILLALSERYAFDLIDASDPALRVELIVEGEPLEVALARLLQGTPYLTEYGPDEANRGSALRRLEVGVLSMAAREGAAQPVREGRADERRERERAEEAAARPPRDPQARRASLERRRAHIEHGYERVVESLDSADPEVRKHSAFLLDAGRAGHRERLSTLLREDPDPEVRVEAARQLSFGRAQEASRDLVRALDDPHPKVVAAALEALSWTRDPSLVPRVRGLLEHPVEDVRREATRALAYLESPR